MPIVLGVDSSTTATKVEARDADSGRLVGTARASHPPTRPPRSEQDPAVWWNAALDGVHRSGHSADSSAISIAAQQHGLVALDAAGEVIRPAKLWNDTESAPDAAWLLDQLDGGAATWARRTGSVPTAAFTISKLSWLHRVEPDAFARLARVLLPHDWLTWRLTERCVTDRGDASGTGYWSPAEGRWCTDLLEIVDADTDWESALPLVVGPIEAVEEREAGLVAPGTGDNMAAALGLGLGPGDVAVSIGTSGTVFAVSEHPTADATGAVAGFADATGRFLPLVCTLNATKVTDAVARLLGVDHDGLDSLALAADPGAGGVVLVPWFDGERTPNLPDATGTLAGLRADATREQVARAAFEGVVCALLDGLDALGAALRHALPNAPVTTDGRLFLVGGGSRSEAYRKVLADLAHRPVVVPEHPELVAAGACVQAAAVLHRRPPLEVAAAWHLGDARLVEPDLGVDAGAVRAAYAAVARSEQARSSGSGGRNTTR